MGVADYIIRKMKEEYHAVTGGDPEKMTVVATGGLATMISHGVESIDHVDRLLTLEGLNLIYEKNKNNFGNRNNSSREHIEMRAEE
jgi:type III pantothenate kinase